MALYEACAVQHSGLRSECGGKSVYMHCTHKRQVLHEQPQHAGLGFRAVPQVQNRNEMLLLLAMQEKAVYVCMLDSCVVHRRCMCAGGAAYL